VNGSPERAEMPRAALRVAGLTKRYGDYLAVDEISLRVDAGDFFGFLGPNGAGKTTTINAIVGLAQIDGGSIEVFGHDVVRDWRAARRLIGLAPQEYNFDRYLSIRDVLIFQAGYYGLRPQQVRARADDLLERFGLSSKANQTYVKLSGGMKRRLSLARALIHSPQLLILDEPTAGVDVELRIELWELLKHLNAEGTTIILTTHYLEEAQALCRNLAIIEGGKIIAMEATERLLSLHGRTSLIVTLDRPANALPPDLLARGVRVAGEPRLLRFESLPAGEIGGVLQRLAELGYAVENVETAQANLQDVFLELVGR
jgi:ABC-2 type transport system ATP-binding protein